MKSLSFHLRLALLALLCCAATTTGAQKKDVVVVAPSSWIKVMPEGKAFSVLMPESPSAQEERRSVGGLYVSGLRYRVKDSGDAVYTIWSFKTQGVPAGVQNDTEAQLDLCAELAWDLLVKSEWERARKRGGTQTGEAYGMSYQRGLSSPTHPGRNYLLGVGKHRGATQIYLKGSQVYIVAALGEAGVASNPEVFMKSFSLKTLQQDEPTAPVAGTATERVGNVEGGKVKEGEAKSQASIDYTKPFPSKELTKKAQIRGKPEPAYTDEARKFGVTGTVRVRLILMASGQVGGITVLTRLPHGLTQEAIDAARKIKFEPGIKDGRPVSQYVTIEYNFNIY